MKEPNEIERMARRCAWVTLSHLKSSLRDMGFEPDPKIDEDEHRKIDEALHAKLAGEFEKALLEPIPFPAALASALPVVLYFKTDHERAAFVQIVQEAHPGLTAKRL